MWNFARGLKAFERDTKSKPELGGALAVWWSTPFAKAALPATADFEEYLIDLTDCYARAKTPLGSNPLENAIKTLSPLADGHTFKDKLNRLKELCGKLQAFAGSEPFYISLRDVGRVIENKDPYAAKKILAFLVTKKTLTVVKKGGPETMKATRYRFNK